MPTFSLSRRRTQRELLARLCELHRPAQVSRAGELRVEELIRTRFLSLSSDALLLDWPHGPAAELAQSVQRVDLYFDHDGQRFVCRTAARGRVGWVCPQRGRIGAWQLDVPLRMEEWRPRLHARIRLDRETDVPVTFTATDDPQRKFQARLRDLSVGGLAARADFMAALQVSVGELYWTSFCLPPDPRPLEFVLRVAHARKAPGPDFTTVGGPFCATDDTVRYAADRARIAEFVRVRQAVAPDVAGRSGDAGGA